MGNPTQKTTETKSPWQPAQGYLTDVLQQAKGLYDTGAGTNLYQGPFVAGTNPTLQQGFDATKALAGTDTSAPFDYAQGVVRKGGISDDMRPALGVLGNIASGGNQIGTSGFSNVIRDAGAAGNTYGDQFDALARNITGQNRDVYGGMRSAGRAFGNVYGQTQGPTAAETNLQGVAQGDGSTNPYLQSVLDNNADRANRRVASTMSGMGRYGSGAHEYLAGKGIAEATAPVLAQEYDTAMGRKLAANQQIDSTRQGLMGLSLNAAQGGLGAASALGGQRNADTSQQAGLLGSGYGTRSNAFGQQLGAANAQAGVEGQNVANQMNAASGLLGTYANGQNQAGQWASMLPQLDALRYSGANATTGIGQWQQNQDQMGLDAQRQLAQQTNALPWAQLGQYAGMTAPMGAMGGQSSGTSTTQQPIGNMIAGGLLGGAGLVGNLGGFGPNGWLYGGANGLLGGKKAA